MIPCPAQINMAEGTKYACKVARKTSGGQRRNAPYITIGGAFVLYAPPSIPLRKPIQIPSRLLFV